MIPKVGREILERTESKKRHRERNSRPPSPSKKREQQLTQHLTVSGGARDDGYQSEERRKGGREREQLIRLGPIHSESFPLEKRMFPLGGQDNLNFPRQAPRDARVCVHRCMYVSITPLNRIRYERQIQTLTTTKLADERPLAAFSLTFRIENYSPTEVCTTERCERRKKSI